MGGENEDRRLRKLLADLVGGIQTLGRVARRHSDVDDRQLGPVFANERNQLGGIVALARDFKAGTLEQARQPFAEEHVVIRENDSDRILTHTSIMG
jgi:hypothetical protein